MFIYRKLSANEVALTVCFTALYVVFGFLKISPIIGLPGQAITAAAIMAPLIGIILGPYIGTLSTFFGGIIGFFFGSFSQLSFASGIFATLCSGLIHKGQKIISALVYLSLLLLLAFYPATGPAWLYPASMWFQIVGLITLVLPLQPIAAKKFNSNNNSKLFYTFFVTSLTSTLAGQIAGSLTLEIIHISDVDYFKTTWEAITFLYPIERTIIALSAASIGVSLYKVLKSANLMPFSNRTNCQENCS
jgi:hypothetical protein